MSGYVLGPDGGVRFFWTGLDEAGRADTFTVWRTAEARPDWLDDEEFRDAYADATGEDAGAASSRVQVDRHGIVRLVPETMEPPAPGRGGAAGTLGAHAARNLGE